jgi:calcineurin-like phosphoesterase
MKKRSLDDIISEMQNQAAAKGLTQDILDEILKDA